MKRPALVLLLAAASLSGTALGATPLSPEAAWTEAAAGWGGLTAGGSRGAPPMQQLQELSERAKRIDAIHSEPIIRPRWIPRYVRDIPSFRLIEGPTADKEGFLARLWRVPASPVVAPLGGMWDSARQWSRVAWDGGDTAGRLAFGVLGGLFGLIVGAVVGAAGVVVNAAMAVKNLFSGKF